MLVLGGAVQEAGCMGRMKKPRLGGRGFFEGWVGVSYGDWM